MLLPKMRGCTPSCAAGSPGGFVFLGGNSSEELKPPLDRTPVFYQINIENKAIGLC